MKMIQHTEEKLKTSVQEKKTQGQGVATFFNKVLQRTKNFWRMIIERSPSFSQQSIQTV
jgi:hypothetical protein